MKMDKVAGSGNDEFYTPKYAIEPILKYLPKGAKVWCPFDTTDSNFYKLLSENGYEVKVSHLESGVDFFNLEQTKDNAEGCEYIVSNPPYSLKAKVFDQLFNIGKPFAMLVGVVGLFESQKRFNMFKDNTFEIMYLNKEWLISKIMQMRNHPLILHSVQFMCVVKCYLNRLFSRRLISD